MSTASGFDRSSILSHGNVIVSILGVVFLWWLLAVSGAIGSLPGPLPSVEAMVSMLPTSKFHSSVIASLSHIYIPYLLATVLAVPLGVAIGMSLTFRDLVFPSLEILRPVPPIAWIPIAILVLPTTVASIMFITFMGAFFPILLNTIRGVKRVEPDYVKAIKCLGGTRRDVLRQVILPAALPSIHTGLVVGMGLAWVNLVAAELIADAGLGRLIWIAYTTGNYPNIIAGVIFVGILGYASSAVVRWIGRLQMSWNAEDAT